MLAGQELKRLRTRKDDLLREVERDRSALAAACRAVNSHLLGVQRIGQLARSAFQWRAALMPVAFLILPRRIRHVIRLANEAAKAFQLAKILTGLWRGATENHPGQKRPTGLA